MMKPLNELRWLVQNNGIKQVGEPVLQQLWGDGESLGKPIKSEWRDVPVAEVDMQEDEE